MAPRKTAQSGGSSASTPTRAVSSSTIPLSSSPPASSPSTTKVTASARSSTTPLKNDPTAILFNLWDSYLASTPQRVMLIDVFMLYLVSSGAIQFLYCVVAGNYPFNAFLSGFCATVGQFVLTASLRIQTNPENSKEFEGTSPERAFADFLFGSLLLHFFCVNFIN